MIRPGLKIVVALGTALLFVWTLAACGDDTASTGGGADNQNQQDDTSCESNADCEGDEICVRSEPGEVGECVDPIDELDIGEECSESAECESGLCYEGVCTDECESAQDCPETMACRSAGDDVAVCLPREECDSDADCDDDTCIVDRNGEVDVYCNIPVGPGEFGDECSVDADCQSGLCLDGQCSAPCAGPEDCNEVEDMTCSGEDLGDGESTNVCTELEESGELCLSDDECTGDDRCVATVDDDEVVFMCGEPNEGGVEGGEACVDDADCAQNLCHEGACQAPCYEDQMCEEIPASSCTTTDVELDGAQGTVNTCEVPVLCVSPAGCENDETCYVERGAQSVDTICEVPDEGERQDGEPCSQDSDCASNYCHDDAYEDYCATPCEVDEDCPTEVGGLEMSCETADIEHGSGSDPVDVCLREDPEPCSTDEDCSDEQACAIVANEHDGGIETVCLPDNGGMDTGMPCDEDSDCVNRHCIGDTCSAPCETYEQCDPYQVCDEETVSKDGESGDVDLCTNLDFMACMSPSDCDPANTTCNAPTFDADGFVDGASCGINNPGQADLGQECSAPADCESAFCWESDDGTTGECSVFCQDSAQDCASDQYCVGRVAGLGLCFGECENNEECEGGNVCKLGTDPANTELYRYCGNTLPDADLQPGDECSSPEECDNGLCLTVTTYEVTGQSCTSDTICDPGFECVCPPGEPNCDLATERECVSETGTVEQQCSELCDPAKGNADCEGKGHELTECSPNIEVEWGNVLTTTAACTFPDE